MSSIVVGIDLGQSHIRVAGLVLDKYIVAQGTKDIKVDDEDQPPNIVEVKEVFDDARKAFAPNFQAAVVVVPNSTSSANREAVAHLGRTAGNIIFQVISEHTAAAAAYVEIVKPTANKQLAIISVTGGFLDLSIILVRPDTEEFDVVAHQTRPEPIEFESGPGGDTLAVALLQLQETPVDEVVFVGKAATSDKLKQRVKERLPDATVWSPPEEIVAAENLAAYGGGVIANKKPDAADDDQDSDDN